MVSLFTDLVSIDGEGWVWCPLTEKVGFGFDSGRGFDGRKVSGWIYS